ncbi:MAG: MlaD family protein [Candidatus Omnitrophota bacterium]
MIFGQSKLELKVGIFVFAGLLILTIFVLSIGDFRTMASTYEVNFIFNFANGVKIGAPVRFSGVDVGQIKEIKFITAVDDPKPKVQIVGQVRKEVKIPLDSSIWVNTLGLLGEKYIEIMPGDDYSQFVIPKQSLEGVDPMPMQEMTVLAKNIAQHLDDGLLKIINKEGTLGKLLYDDTIYKDLETLVSDIKNHPWKLFWKGKEKPAKK